MSRLVPEDIFDWVWIPFIRTLVFLRLGSITRAPSNVDSGRTRVLWEEAIRRGITLEEFHPLNIGQDIFLARLEKKTILKICRGPRGSTAKELTGWTTNMK